MRVLVVEDEPYLAEAVRDGLRLEAIDTVTGVGYRIDTGMDTGMDTARPGSTHE